MKKVSTKKQKVYFSDAYYPHNLRSFLAYLSDCLTLFHYLSASQPSFFLLLFFSVHVIKGTVACVVFPNTVPRMTKKDFKNFIRGQMFEIYETSAYLGQFSTKIRNPCILSVFRFSRQIFVLILSYYSILILSCFHFSSFVYSNLSQFPTFMHPFLYLFFAIIYSFSH